MKILHVTEGVSDLATGQIAVVKNLIKYQGVSNNIGLFSIDFSTNVNIDGLNNYYKIFPQVCESKYKTKVLNIDVSETDIRTGQGKIDFLEQIRNFLRI